LLLVVRVRGPAIGNEIDRLQVSLPQAARALLAQLHEQPWGQWILTHVLGAVQSPQIVDWLPRVSGFVSGTLGFIGGLVIVVVLGIAIAAEPQTYLQGFERLFPTTAQAYVDQVMGKIANTLRFWLVARLAAMCCVGILISSGLWMLGIPMAGTLGLLAALVTFVPNLGPILSAIPPILLAFAISPRHGVLVVLLFWTVHSLEGLLINPIADRAVVRLPPALTLSAQLVLAFLAGPIGIALAAPLTLVAVVLIRTVYAEKVLSN